MKRSLQGKSIISAFALLVLMAIVPFASAQKVQLNDDGTNLKITENTYTLLGLKNTVSEITAFEVKSSKGDFSQIRIDGYGYSNNIGEPKLPVIKKLIEVPLRGDYNIDITYQGFTDYTLADFGLDAPIFPAQPSLSKSEDPDEVPFEIDLESYGMDALLGNQLVDVIPLGIMRGLNLARVEIAPVQYNPVQGKIRVYENLEVNISFTGANVPETIQLKADQTNRYFKSMSRLVFNYKEIQSDGFIDDAPVTYIVVSDPMFQEALQPFVEWKNKKGFKVVEAYTDDPQVGSTTSSIKSYLEDFYNDPPAGYNPQSFVLFVGDVAQIPTFDGDAGYHVTDLYYCEYTGDWFPEAYYGRFSANNLNELQPQIDKTLEYEQYTFPDPSFLDEVVMVAGADASHSQTWGNGQINYGTEYYFNAEHGLFSHTYLQPEPGGGNYSQQIKQNVSDGVSYANYTAHCSPSGWADPSFVMGDVSSLTNAHKYPLMVGNCCSSVEFQMDCFGEEVLRAPLKGALGYIGGSNSTYWDEDYWWGVGFETVSANPSYNPENLGAYDRMFHDQDGITMDDWYVTQGQMSAAGNLAVTQSGSSREEYYWEIYHLMGDPSLMIYFSQPPEPLASYPGLMPVGSPTFTVTTEPYAYVAISKDGVLHGTALADETGVAEIEFEIPVTVPGIADVVITGQNLMPYMGELTVASPDGAYVLLDGFEVNDNSGNNNGQVDYGEPFALDISMKNLGSSPATSVELYLTSEDEYVNIPNGMAVLGDIDPDEVKSITGAFGDIEPAMGLPDGHSIAFTLEATDGTDTWTSNFQITAHAPVLQFNDFTILDPSGNNNGKIDPGETVEILISVINDGSSEAYEVMGGLSSASTFITVNTTDPQEFGNVTPGGEAIASFEVTANESTPAGQIAMFNVAFEASMGITAEGEFSLVIGQIPVIIVDLDENNSSAPEIQSDIEDLGVAVEYSTSFPEDLDLYSSIFVCLGIYANNYELNESDGQALADYLNNGGFLYMEGGDTWAFDDQTAVHGMFGINGTEDGSGDLGTIMGVSGTMTEGMSLNYTGENNWIDQLESTGTGEVILNNQNPSYGCAVSNDPGDYKTIGASFEYGGLEETSRTALMEAYLEFFNLMGGAMNCVMTAVPAEICQGESSQLNVEVYGGSGNYSYDWLPAESLSDPNIHNPVASPDESLMYSVTITDMTSGDELVDEMWLEVMEVPEPATITQVGENLVSGLQFGNQWYDDDGAIAGATGQIYSPTESGNYYTIVTNNFGCESDMSNVLYFQPTFIEELSRQGSLRVYPNPAGNEVNIDFLAETSDVVTIAILNAYGQLMEYQEISDINKLGLNTLHIDMTPYEAGVYYIKLQNKEKAVTKKIILSH